jgi:hypothetical protein
MGDQWREGTISDLSDSASYRVTRAQTDFISGPERGFLHRLDYAAL